MSRTDRAAPRPGACSGIGFGCSLNGADLAAFLLLLVGVPYAAGLAVILGLRSLVAERFVGIPIAVAAVGVAIPWAFVVAILISLGY